MIQHTPKNLLLTGPPGCGKTTAVRRLIDRLSDLRLAGFYTQELREGGKRVGFEIVGLSARQRALLAHARSRSHLRAGRYGVEATELAQVVEEELARPAGDVDLFVVDEVGKMELLCGEFVNAVRRLLDGVVPVVATVAMKGGGLIGEVKARANIRLVEVILRRSPISSAAGRPGVNANTRVRPIARVMDALPTDVRGSIGSGLARVGTALCGKPRPGETFRPGVTPAPGVDRNSRPS
jgi:nucleoside-triphosphatase